MKTYQTYTIKVSLRYTQPPIWRRFAVRSDVSLATLHPIIDTVIGWRKPQPYWFETADGAFFIATQKAKKSMDVRKFLLGSVLERLGQNLSYHRGFWENWQHDLLLEATSPGSEPPDVPICLDGARGCPPEDYASVADLRCLGRPRRRIFKGSTRLRGRDWHGVPQSISHFDIKGINRSLRSIQAG